VIDCAIDQNDIGPEAYHIKHCEPPVKSIWS